MSSTSDCEGNLSLKPDLNLGNEHAHDLEDVEIYDFTQNQHHSEK